MQAPTIHSPVANAKPILPFTRADKIRKNMAKLAERQLKLDAAKEKAAKELEDADRSQAIEAGQTEFIRAIEELDLSVREMAVSTVLQSFKDDSRRAKIQAWVAAIPERKPLPDSTHKHDQPEASSDAAPTPPANPAESTSAKPESSASESTPTG